jgi:hypothetical protein
MKEVLGFVNCGFDEEKCLISVHKSEERATVACDVSKTFVQNVK